MNELPRRLEAVTDEQVAAAAQTLLDQRKAILVIEAGAGSADSGESAGDEAGEAA